MNDFASHIKNIYSNMGDKHKEARAHFNRPLTYAEKVLSLHMKTVSDEKNQELKRGVSYAEFFPDRVAMQDATAQMALLQFMNAGRDQVAVPSTVHCDHLIAAISGAKSDLERAKDENREVYDFLKSVSKKYGIGFWKPGSGIIHQVVLENYAFPGGMMIGTDSHTPNAGGLGMIAIGVGGADAVDVMTNEPLYLKWPGIIGVHLKGKLSGWTSAKDVILKLMGILTVKGGTGHIVEFFGDGCSTISATGKATITNMGAEHGATTSVFPFDTTMEDYLQATKRREWAKLAGQFADCLRADPEVYAEPQNFYDRVIEIDLNILEPHIVGPHSPDISRPLSEFKKAIKKEGYPSHPKAALIGSCTNSSYEDLGRAASIAKFAASKGIKAKIPFLITPGSDTVYATITRDKQAEALTKIGGTMLANACGPCIGQWKRNDIEAGEKNSIISSYNRNFPGRNDGNRETLSFIASPEVVTAIALAGDLAFDPTKDTLESNKGQEFMLPTPQSDALPSEGFETSRAGFVEPAKEPSRVRISIASDSKRLCLLERFPKFNGEDFMEMPILLKAKGKCTTDHISQAGPWLRFRGHLGKIADNTYLGAINAFSDGAGKGIDLSDPEKPTKLLPEIGRIYKQKGISWVVVGDENFGEGSSREHAAMQPRYLGCKTIIARSFARIHENNLKKHGILPLTFQNTDDYDKVDALDRVDILDLNSIEPNKPVMVRLHHEDGTSDTITCNHSMSDEQLLWFKEGSALNYLSHKSQKEEPPLDYSREKRH